MHNALKFKGNYLQTLIGQFDCLEQVYIYIGRNCFRVWLKLLTFVTCKMHFVWPMSCISVYCTMHKCQHIASCNQGDFVLDNQGDIYSYCSQVQIDVKNSLDLCKTSHTSLYTVRCDTNMCVKSSNRILNIASINQQRNSVMYNPYRDTQLTSLPCRMCIKICMYSVCVQY